MNIILLGPPGAGKGTQAKRIAGAHSLVHLSSGDLLRAERAADSELGRKVSKFMDAGKLVPDELVTQVVLNRVRQELSSDENGVLLDGFPRTLSQAKDLDVTLTDIEEQICGAINLTLDDEQIVRRLTGRRSCPKCGAVYHVKAKPPKRAGRCDVCGSEVVQRSDDAEEVVRERLEVYRRQTQPLEEYYRQAGLLQEVDSDMEIDTVTGEIEELLRSCCFEK